MDLAIKGYPIGMRLFKAGQFPGPTDAGMKCGNCGGSSFGIYVQPRDDEARVSGFHCLGCGKIWRVDMTGFIGGKGKAGIEGIPPADPTPGPTTNKSEGE